MALIAMKFRLSWIVLSVAFIPLSVLANPVQPVKGHRCYWCGPLAEQVHRSQRAAKCNGDKSKVTVCDEDLPFCAIVASSPPYVESRYCVKFYQDECYPLYCNSTKIWKVICTCRGELCNGPNTQRENEVFEPLHKLTQTKRHKRAMISQADFINITPRKNKTEDVTTEKNINDSNEMESDNKVDGIINEKNDNGAHSITEVDYKHDDSEVIVTEAMPVTASTPTSAEIDKISPTATSESSDAAKTDLTSNDFSETTAVETTPAQNNAKKDTDIPNEATNGNPDSERIIQIDIHSASVDSDDLKTEIIVMSTEIPNPVNNSKSDEKSTKITEMILNTQTTTPGTQPTTAGIKDSLETTKMIKPTQSEEKLEMPKSKTNENMPTAVALQHTDTPTTKLTSEQTRSTGPTTMNMNTHIDLTTEPTKPDNNTSIRIKPHILTIAIGAALFY